MEIPNYIKEINMFYDWLETNQIPKSAIALWHTLMHIANKSKWENKFTVATSTIESKSGFKRSELFKARNILEQKGRLTWKSRGGNLCAEYQLIFFSVHNKDTNGNTNGNANGNANGNTNGSQTVTINKRNETKQNETNNSKSHSENEFSVIEKIENLKNGETPENQIYKELVAVWFDFYHKQFLLKPTFGAVDGSKLKSIEKKLKTKCDEFNQNWNEVSAGELLAKFLENAYSDKWLKENFQLSILDSKFDIIIQKSLKSTNAVSKAAAQSILDRW